jgi:serine phosphatase RsbU (regulator of sigma subunit)
MNVRLLHAESPAFRQAVLKSERLRIFILFFVMGVAILFRVVRTLIAWNLENAGHLLWLVLFAALLTAIELFVLYALGKAIKSGDGSLSHPLWMSNILLETCFPAILIVVVSSGSIAPEFQALVNPAFLVYFAFITLSTLRLRPLVSVACGITSMVTYLLAAHYYGWGPRWILVNAPLFTPQKIVSAYATALLVAGLTAALVARELRNQVEAALREAETRREMEHLQHDLDVARTIQQSLLPKSMPKVAGFDIAAWNKPADETGGDYYDWQALPDGRILVALGDVTGHGIGPALLASVCRAYARATFGQYSDFLKSMEQINTAISADVTEGRFITFVAAIIGPANTPVELLSAGHAPLFFYRLKNDTFDKMEAQGLPLGITSDFLSDPSKALPFGSGDILILITDGFFEWANVADEQFGSGRLEASVRANRDKSASEIIAALHKDVLRFSGGTTQKDDLTAIIIKRL